MKAQDQKMEFIRLRADGKSYAAIADILHISKSTCTAWEREFKEAIAEIKQEKLNELYQAYFMGKEARIKRLGETLNAINATLEKMDFSEIPPEKLLDFKLKYFEALKSEFSGMGQPFQFVKNRIEPRDIVDALGDLLNRIRAGDVTVEQANKESVVIASLLKAYDLVEVKAKLDALESIVESRN